MCTGHISVKYKHMHVFDSEKEKAVITGECINDTL